jgi:exoribonuclease R
VKFQEENEDLMPTHSELEEINEEILRLENKLNTQIQTFETYKIHEEATIEKLKSLNEKLKKFLYSMRMEESLETLRQMKKILKGEKSYQIRS